MARKLFLALCITFMLVSCKSCKKDNLAPVDQLPPATQNGQNTFGCLINGEVFTPKGAFSVPRLYADYYNGGVYLICAVNVDSRINILLKNDSSLINNTGNYSLISAIDKNTYGQYANLNSNCNMYTDSISSGTLTVTKFSITSQKRIISGTFYFTVKSPGCPDIHVTDGRFDISF
jgi:hypothetical protein